MSKPEIFVTFRVTQQEKDLLKQYDKFFILDDSRRFNMFSRVCGLCQHFNVGSISDPAMNCKAFPAGIPMEIWDGRNPHTEPYPGDGGIQFERAQP